jgi:hypothetical protein
MSLRNGATQVLTALHSILPGRCEAERPRICSGERGRCTNKPPRGSNLCADCVKKQLEMRKNSRPEDFEGFKKHQPDKKKAGSRWGAR